MVTILPIASFSQIWTEFIWWSPVIAGHEDSGSIMMTMTQFLPLRALQSTEGHRPVEKYTTIQEEQCCVRNKHPGAWAQEQEVPNWSWERDGQARLPGRGGLSRWEPEEEGVNQWGEETVLAEGAAPAKARCAKTWNALTKEGPGRVLGWGMT